MFHRISRVAHINTLGTVSYRFLAKFVYNTVWAHIYICAGLFAIASIFPDAVLFAVYFAIICYFTFFFLKSKLTIEFAVGFEGEVIVR